MGNMKYEVGAKLWCNGCIGEVVPNIKLPEDICIKWDVLDEITSYDVDWLDENVDILEN